MKRWLALCVLLGACVTEEEVAVVSDLTRSPATAAHPSVVHIQISDGIGLDSVCTASILSRRWLMTAAHCWRGQPQGVQVTVRTGQNHEVPLFSGPAFFTIHPDWHDTIDDVDDDISLLRLSGNGMTGISEQMGLYMGGISEGDRIVVVGYGHGTDVGGSEWCDGAPLGIKREQDYNLLDVYSDELTFDWGHEKTCGGDSGAPYIFPNASHNFAAAVHSQHHDFTNNAMGPRVSAKRDWILSTLLATNPQVMCQQFVAVGEQFVSYTSCFEEEQKVRGRALTAGRAHACAVLVDGRARCWGDNAVGQLGDLTASDRRMPVTADANAQFKDITAGSDHTCGITLANEVRCWGTNASRQLGNPTIGTGNFAIGQRVQFADGTPLRDVRAITAGSQHTCALTNAGRVWCWGSNARGQLGIDSTTASSTTPALVGRFESIVIGFGFAPGGLDERTFIPLENVTQIEAGQRHTCAVLADGTARCWGDNTAGQLGNGTTVQANKPVTVAGLTNVFRISGGLLHTCATFGNAATQAACWGFNSAGQLGDGTQTNSSLPRTVATGLPGAIEVAAGSLHTCWTSSGQQKCAGDSNAGALGILSSALQLVPVSSNTADARMPTAGEHFTCTLKFNGTVMCSGKNADGQLGANNLVNQRYLYPVHHLHHLQGAP
jgi:alpha-tubulin suppressor-like RCC1 family protein